MGCPSGQRELTVNQPRLRYVGSNPTPTTIESRVLPGSEVGEQVSLLEQDSNRFLRRE